MQALVLSALRPSLLHSHHAQYDPVQSSMAATPCEVAAFDTPAEALAAVLNRAASGWPT